MPKQVVFLTNTPVPYQLDLFGKLAEKTPVKMLLVSEGNTGQNVAWKLDLPDWVQVVDAAVLRQLNPDETAYVMCGGYKLPYAKALKTWARKHKIPFYYWMERPQPHTGVKGLLRNVYLRWVLRDADGVWGVDTQAVKLYQNYNKNVEQLPYAISGFGAAQVRQGAVSSEVPLKCLYVGQYIERKGIDILLGAFETIDPKQAQLTFVGKGELDQEIQAFCERTGHKNVGFTQPRDLPQVLLDHDVFVFPSRYDGWGVVVAEAMAAGMPVLTGDMVGAHDLLDEKSGQILPLKAEAFRAAVLQYAENVDLLKTHAKGAFQAWEASRANTKHAVDFLLKYCK